MSKLSIFIFLLIGFHAFSEDEKHMEVAEYSVDSVIANSGISEGSAEVALGF